MSGFPKRRLIQTLASEDVERTAPINLTYLLWRNPENFKGVWWPHGTYLYDDSVGNCTKNITSYFQRLKKLFTHTHTFIGSRELNTLKECYPNFGQKENEE